MLRHAVIGAAILGALSVSACTIEDEPDLAVVPAPVIQTQPAPMVIERQSTIVKDRVY